MSEALKAFIEQCCKSPMLQNFPLSEVRPGEIFEHVYTCTFTPDPRTFKPAVTQLIGGVMIGIMWNEAKRALLLTAGIQYDSCSPERVEEIVRGWNLNARNISRVVNVIGITDSIFLLTSQFAMRLATSELPVDDSGQPARDHVPGYMALFIAECIQLTLEPF